MSAAYPTSTKSFTTKTNGQQVAASHVDDLQDEVVAIEADLRAGLPVARGGTGLLVGTSGGVLGFTSTSALASSALLTQHAVMLGGGAGATPATVAAMTTGQQLFGVTGADPVPGKPAISATTPANPTGTTSATAVMMGLGGTATITPVVTGRIKITINGNYANTNLAAGTFLQLAYGTGTAPVNGAAAAGTAAGSLLGNSQDVAANANVFSLTWIVQGLTLSTAVWLDLQVKCTAGTATVTNLAVVALEI